jgi:superfamily II DNA helicase RecQ
MDLITVFVGTSYSATATRNALYQLIGRAGRTGKSYRAKVLFQDDQSLRTAMLPANENIEAQVIEFHLAQVMTTKIPEA